MPQRATFPAANVLASDISDSNREYRGMGMRTSAFPYQPQVSQINKTVVQASANVAASTSILLETNGSPNPSQAVLNLIQGSGITLTTDSLGGVTILSLAATDGLTHGTTPWEIDPSAFIWSEDFQTAPQGGGLFLTTQGPWGNTGWWFGNNTTPSNVGTSGWGSLYGQLGGSICWENPGTVHCGMLVPFNVSTSTFFTNGAMALAENPGWKATFIWKFDAGINTTSTTFNAAKKAFYIGFSSSCVPAIYVNAATPGQSSRPLSFVGLRYDTSTSQPTVTLTAAAVPSGMSGVATSYTHSSALGSGNSWVGQQFTVTGFVTAGNNCTNKTCIFSDASHLILLNGSGAAETHAGTATSNVTAPNDTNFTFESVDNINLSGQVASRNNLQGTTVATTVAPQQGYAYRLDVACTVAGQLKFTLNGYNPLTLATITPQTATLTVPTITRKLQFANSTQGANSVLTNNSVDVQGIGVGGNALNTVDAQAGALPFGPGSVVTIAGLASTLAPLNGKHTLTNVVAGVNMFFDFTNANITSVATTNGATVTGYPALLPIVSFGDDDSAGLVAQSMRIYFDYFGLAVNPALGTGGSTANSLFARYF
jgi:hypothetical protein